MTAEFIEDTQPIPIRKHLSEASREDTQPIPVKRQAGASTHQMADRRRKSMLIWGLLGIAGILIIAFIIVPNAGVLGIGAGGIGLLILAVLTIRWIAELFIERKAKEARRARRGARGEEKIGELLGGLMGDFEVLHDVPCAFGNIDHVVVSGRGNVFMIETKSHGGKVTAADGRLQVNGHDPEKDFIAQSLRNSFWLRDQIEASIGVRPRVIPIVVFTNAFVTASGPVKGVSVVNKKYLLKTIQYFEGRNQMNPLVWQKRGGFINRLAL